MDSKEITNASEALISWFETQEINPPNAVIVMMNTIAACMVEKATSQADLDHLFSLSTKMLATIVEDKVNDRG